VDSAAYKRYALASLTLVYAVNLLDRGFIFMLLEPIRLELAMSDTQVGFVTGIAFAFFYATLGIPIARWADRGNRVTITSLAIGLWAVTTMLCSYVTSYVQFLIARIAAGVGDAGCQPPIYSLIGDYFPQPAERTRALYVFEVASPIASLLSFAAAGWLNETIGWRRTLLLVGLPGLALALLVRLTIEEPRLATRNLIQRQAVQMPLMAVLGMMWKQDSCRNLMLAMILLFTMGGGVVGWQPAFMIRVHEIGTTELGVWMALIHGLGSTCGLLLGIFVLGKWFVGNERGQVHLAALAIVLQIPFYIAFLTLPDAHLALIALIPVSLLFSAFVPASFALLQRLVPSETRATVMFVMLFFASLIGAGVGPLTVGVLSDYLKPTMGEEALGRAMLIMSFIGVWVAWHFVRVGRYIDRDLNGGGGPNAVA
jgi:MFS family permease